MTPVITKEVLTGAYIFNFIIAAFLRNLESSYFVAVVFRIGAQHLYMER